MIFWSFDWNFHFFNSNFVYNFDQMKFRLPLWSLGPSNFDDRNKQLECSLNHFQISIIQIMVLNPLLNCYEISTISNFDQAGEARSKFWFSNFNNQNIESFRSKFRFSNFEDSNFESFRSKFWFLDFDNRNFESFH